MKFGNPYVTDKSVGSTDAFVGRQDILYQVKAVLEQKKAIILNGLRRIGKTSVLHELTFRLPDDGPYVPVYLTLNDKVNSSLEEVLQELANRIRDAISPLSSEPDLNADPNRFFRVLLPELLKKLSSGKSLVLLLDELEIWAAAADGNAKQASVIFFPYLSDLLHSDYNLKFVFTIGCSFAQFNEEALRAFREITDVTRISLLKKEETKKIIRFSEGNNTLKWSIEAVEKIWEQTQGHPFLTQALCEKVWNTLCGRNKNSSIPTATINDVEQTITEILKNENNLPALYWIWDGLPSTEQLVASALATKGFEPITQFELGDFLRKKEVPVGSDKAIASLKEWDFIEPVEENGYRFRVEFLRRWIAEYRPFNKTRDEYRKTEDAIQYYEKGKKLYEEGNSSEALEALYRAINLNPELMGATQLLAKILLEDERPDTIEYARELLGKAVDYGYDLHNTRFLYVKALLKSAKLASNEEEQLTWCEHVLEIEPENHEAKSIVNSRLIRGALFLAKHSKNDDERLMLYERVLELEPEHKEANHQQQVILQKGKSSKENVLIENSEYFKTLLEEKLSLINTRIDETFAKVKSVGKKQWSLIGINVLSGICLGIVIIGFFEIKQISELDEVNRQLKKIQAQTEQSPIQFKNVNAQIKKNQAQIEQISISLDMDLNKCGSKYEVKSGDSYSEIAKDCYGNYRCWVVIAEENWPLRSTQINPEKHELNMPVVFSTDECLPVDEKVFYKLGKLAEERCGSISYWKKIYKLNKQMVILEKFNEHKVELPPKCNK